MAIVSVDSLVDFTLADAEKVPLGFFPLQRLHSASELPGAACHVVCALPFSQSLVRHVWLEPN